MKDGASGAVGLINYLAAESHPDPEDGARNLLTFFSALLAAPDPANLQTDGPPPKDSDVLAA